jgi:hypothetical protein
MKQINGYIESKKKVEQYHKEIKNINIEYQTKKREIETLFYEKEREIRNEKYEKEKILINQYNEQNEILNKNNEQYKTDLKEFNYFLDLYDLKEKEFNLNDYEVYYYDYPKKENGENDYSKGTEKFLYKEIEILKNEKFLNLKVYITKNDKPLNKYSLIIIGKSYFLDKFGDNARNLNLSINKDYGIKTHTNNENIRIKIKDFSKEKYALEYYKKNKDKLLKTFLSEHKKVEQDFFKVIKQTDLKSWEIESLKRKKYYYENNYSNGINTEEYKTIMEKLNKLGRF